MKKRHDLEDLVRKRAALDEANPKSKKNKLRGGKKAFYVKKPETFVARSRSRRNNEIRYKRVLKKGMQKRASNKKQTATKEVAIDEETGATATVQYQSNSVGAPMVFVIRIRDRIGAPPIVRQTLAKLRLLNIHEGVFVRYDDKTRKQLHLVEPFVVYGRPTIGVVTDLIERRGFGNVDGKRVPLSNNTVVETALGQEGDILCVEDLVHELHKVGDSFDKAASFLWPFRLADSKTEFERKTLKLKDGKDYGDRGEAINEYIQEVL